MSPDLATRLQRATVVVSVTLLAMAIAVLMVDHLRHVVDLPEFQQRLQLAEDAARRDPAAAQALQREVERQTAISLSRERRRQIAGVVALVAAGVGIASLQLPSDKKPDLPATLAQRMPSATRAAQTLENIPTSPPASGSNDLSRQPAVDLAPVARIVARVGREERHLIPLLHAVESEYRYLPAPALAQICEMTDVSPAQVAGVASFYSQFRTRPRGRHVVQVCQGTACHVAGADRVLQEMRRSLQIPAGDDTDSERNFTVEVVGCLGCCTLAPVLQCDGRTAGRVHVDQLPELIEEYRSSRPPEESGIFVEKARSECAHGSEHSPCREQGGRSALITDESCTTQPRLSVSSFVTRRVMASLKRSHVGIALTTLAATAGRVGRKECHAAAGAESNGHDLQPRDASPPLEIRIGLGSCCVAGGSREVLDALEQELAAQRRQAVIKPVGCVGICHLTPLVEVVLPAAESIVATRATPADVRRIIRALPGSTSWPRRLRGGLINAWQRGPTAESPPPCQISTLGAKPMRSFLEPQVRIVTEHSGQLDPTSLTDYRSRDGFTALEKCLTELSPAAVIDMVEASGLRGRGGGGFPTARKWRLAREASGEKFLVCNGDEGDPGAFMDRMVMESYPFRVLEGMAIAAYAVGARQALLYIRHEYPLAVERIRHAIECMVSAGLLGDNILSSQFSLHVEVVEGAGAFVCGEETALLQSIMGRRGTPQHRPPYPVEQGLWDRPTLVNNVETFANLPWILRQGPQRFAALGTKTSKGTKVFSLAGKIRRGGLVEVPMGVTIRQVVEEIGGGVPAGRQFKAVQIGGPSGGCVPAALADTRIDYEALREVGAIMGSGGLVVMADDDCMVDVARYFLEFTQRESCGHCSFCRIGTRKLLDILERICAGNGAERDLAEIESLSRSVTFGSLCGLGKTAPNPVLTTLRYFREEYEAHLAGRCPAGRCRSLIRYAVNRDCVGCTLCAQRCPVGAIPPTPYRQHGIDDRLCTRCDVCRNTCPENAIEII